MELVQMMTSRVFSLGGGRYALLAVLWMALAWAAPVQAQQIAQQFGGFAADQNAPIEIEANRLDVDDNKKTAVFAGKVNARQGTFTMLSNKLIVYYTGSAADGQAPKKAKDQPGGGDQNIRRIVARGAVQLSNGKDNSATGDEADYDVAKQVITLSGNVVLSQCGNVLKGSAIVINLATGQSQMKNTGTGGRVSALFQRADTAKKKKPQAKAGC